MITSFNWVDSSVVAGIDINKAFSSTFSPPENSNLQLKRLVRHAAEAPKDGDKSTYVSTKAELEHFAVSRAVHKD